MKQREGSKIVAAIVIALLLAAISGWVSDAVYVVEYLEEPAYEVAGVDEPAVDLVALRRSWPQALGNAEDRVRLIGYMSAIPTEAPGQGEAAAAADAAPEPPVDINTRLARADLANGQRSSFQCVACHSFDQGGPAGFGPNLWDIVGRAKAASGGFSYSDVMSDAGGEWAFDELDTFLADPLGTMPGTRMAYLGVRNQQERADLIAYLTTLSNNPTPLPAP